MIEYSDEGDKDAQYIPRLSHKSHQDTQVGSGSQYLRTMVEATAEHLRLTMQHATTIEAPKSFQKFPPQSYLKVLQRTHHREKYTLLPQKPRYA
jgi:hypothetical protein